MSIINVCDICGKQESNKIRFTNEPLKINVKSRDGERYNVYLGINIEHMDDSKQLDKFNKDYIQAQHNGETEMPNLDLLDLKNPNPSFCVHCKKELVKLSLSYGKSTNSTIL